MPRSGVNANAIVVLAVKSRRMRSIRPGKPLRGRFAPLDRSARRWLWLAMFLW
jgi:hypothetical protein